MIDNDKVGENVKRKYTTQEDNVLGEVYFYYTDLFYLTSSTSVH